MSNEIYIQCTLTKSIKDTWVTSMPLSSLFNPLFSFSFCYFIVTFHLFCVCYFVFLFLLGLFCYFFFFCVFLLSPGCWFNRTYILIKLCLHLFIWTDWDAKCPTREFIDTCSESVKQHTDLLVYSQHSSREEDELLQNWFKYSTLPLFSGCTVHSYLFILWTDSSSFHMWRN